MVSIQLNAFILEDIVNEKYLEVIDMSKMLSIIIMVLLTVMICSCGNAQTSAGNPVDDKSTASEMDASEATASNSIDTSSQIDDSQIAQTQSNEAKTVESVSEDASERSVGESVQDDMDELAAIGDVEVENGIMTVKITVPADLSKGMTQEQLDAAVGEKYQSAVLNEDGSVTYKVTKAQHRAMLEGFTASFDEALQRIVDNDETYTIAGITHNEDFTEYNVTLDGSELGMTDSFSVMGMYMYGGIYGIFKGHNPEHVVVNFRDPEGNIVKTADSANVGNNEN